MFIAERKTVVDQVKLKQKLQGKLDELLARAAEIEEKLSDPGEPDWEENALEMEDDEVRAGIGDLTKQEIQDIQRTLKLLESGQYGTCTKCGKAIDRVRLELLPYTLTCVACA